MWTDDHVPTLPLSAGVLVQLCELARLLAESKDAIADTSIRGRIGHACFIPKRDPGFWP
jgi:hypothetical protein